MFDVLRGVSWALTLSFPAIGDGMAFVFTFLDKKVGTRAYSRKLETEADALGLEVSCCFPSAMSDLLTDCIDLSQLMAKAGFDPRAALALWEILNEVGCVTLDHEDCPLISCMKLGRSGCRRESGESRY